jgi:hypothetical protein
MRSSLPRCCFADAMMAVSSAVYETPVRPSSMCALDSPRFFKRRRTAWLNGKRWSPVKDNSMTVHVPSFDIAWRRLAHKRQTVRLWPFEHLGEPRLDPLEGRDMRGWPKLNTMMLAVQAASWMLYRDIIFCGVDLYGRVFDWMVGHLEKWHRDAVRLGMNWWTASDCSRLAAFLPMWEGAEEMAA